MSKRVSPVVRLGKTYHSPCGIHVTRYTGPCPYCARVLAEIRDAPAGVSKFKIGPGQQPLKMTGRAIAKRRTEGRRRKRRRAEKDAASGAGGRSKQSPPR